MNKSLFKTFNSPYHALSFKSSRYKHVVPYFAAVMLILPLLFIIPQSFSVYLVSQVVIFILFPIFLWVHLNTDQVTDIKLDIIKVFVFITIYFSYLLILAWIMIQIFKPDFLLEYVILTIGYISLLFVMALIVTATFFYHRYAQRIIKESKI